MGFALDPAQPLPDELRRVARERLTDARRRLDNETGEAFDTRVHEARKRTKEVRAMLRLVRDEMGKRAYQRENARLRDAARLLAPLRDAQVLREVVDGIDDPSVDAGALDRARQGLDARLRSEKARAVQARSAQRMSEMVAAATDAVAQWPLTRDRWRVVRPGLRRAYARGRAGYAAVAGLGTDEQIHAWRKRVKDLWYDVRLVKPAWPQVLGPTAEEVHRLSDLLGDHHDLSVLVAHLDELGLAPDDRDALVAWATARQGRLRRDAVDLGGRLYAEEPDAFVARISDVYKRARREHRGERHRRWPLPAEADAAATPATGASSPA